ncbi:methylated-DNA--[protein]-cysteine S-methyltransferase [Vitiosangium sp. GDMCC 1.1324]|uniref:methylated-DNA--[protein]-cysteine S-methyltransferase n=1 Tax=Vitiosangium sp. (strain GDMCC 1.1324) TaxID=2138576 RepID=UPI000D3700DF|nr:methylated-DNA--[protein]-cysteine S-methyltransferase [Vitiosangium sp. GDMCC 1.1324]PTL75232.1 cysteine methyltransferase [Vitiosangium sp. GDMCC 1.1324]
MTLFTTTMKSPVGTLRLYATEDALTAIYMENHKGAPVLVANERKDHPVLEAARRQLEEYFAGERVSFDLPLGPAGTPFQQSVWAALREIPLGATWSYANLARHIGREGSARAVGAANGKNPISIIVPCHRVVGTDGSLTGYAGGVPVKQWLLEHEQRIRAGR